MVKKPKGLSPRSAGDNAAGALDEAAEDLFPGALRLAKPGALLIRRILEEGARRGLANKDLAQQSLGVVRTYFADLCNGKKEIPNLGDEAIAKAAHFLGIAPIEAKLLAGQLTAADFYAGPGAYHDSLLPALRYMLDDREYPLSIPVELLEATRNVQSHAVQCYEVITGKKLIRGKLTKDDVLKRYRASTNDQHVPAAGASTGVAAYDRVLRACHTFGITLQSARLRNGSFVDALGIATHGSTWGTDSAAEFDVAKAVETFASEIQLLDSVDPQPDPFHTGIVAAALLALSLDTSTLDFFARLSQTRGKDAGSGLPSPIRRILSVVNRMIKRGAESTNTLREQELCAMTLHAVELWQKPDHGSSGKEPSPKVLSGLLKSTLERVRTRKAAAATASSR